ncbi:MAG: ribulose-phosphate 3-epimerase [Acidobacteria bacterium]|nr:ribulose-phosphate 3-epimerase [Acidobacteriota bacterium]
MRKILVAPSLLSCDLASVATEVASVESGGADLLHFDVMDGVFVPNLTFGPVLCRAVRRITRLPLDVHLMVADPTPLLQPFVTAGADRISVHVEATPHLHRVLDAIRNLGARPGVAINPLTPTVAVEQAWPFVDFILVMTVDPGFGGQRFIPEMLSKLAVLRQTRDGRWPAVELAVDGGVDAEVAPALIDNGADVLIAGTSVFAAADRAAAIRALKGESPR